MKDLVGVNVEDVPAAVRAAVEADAAERDDNRNNVACEIVAAHIGYPWTPTKYGYRAADGATTWNLRMPRAMRDRLSAHARRQGHSQRGVILNALELHYDLPVSSARPRPSQPSPLTPEQVNEVRIRHEAGESVRSLARRFGVMRPTIDRALAGG